MSPKLLHLLRHGAPVVTGRLIGHGDVAPSAERIAACNDQIGALDFDHLVSSDLARAQRAAEAIAAAKTRSLTIDPRWRELDFGAWDGQAMADLDSEAFDRFWDDPDACPPPGGESWSALKARVSAAIDAMAEGSTLVVTHGGAMRAALSLLCGFDRRQVWAFDLPYAALLSLRIWPGDPGSTQIVGLWP